MVSWVWDHFKRRDKESAECKHCKAVIHCKSSNTSGFLRHLREKHSITQNQRNSNQTSIEESLVIRKTLSDNRKETVDKLIINYIINKLMPLNTVEDEDFRKLINYLEPNYHSMSNKSLKTRINDIFEKKCAQLFDELNEMQTVSIDFDTWTSLANESYITVNCHGINNDWKLLSFNLETKILEEAHSAVYLKYIIEQILIKFNLKDKTKFCIHDNAANMNLMSDLLELTDIRCFAHTWDLAVKAVCQMDFIDSLLSKCRKIVGHFNHSSTAKLLLEREQMRIKGKTSSLKQHCETRWGSNI
jgi:hypothetical protein